MRLSAACLRVTTRSVGLPALSRRAAPGEKRRVVKSVVKSFVRAAAVVGVTAGLVTPAAAQTAYPAGPSAGSRSSSAAGQPSLPGTNPFMGGVPSGTPTGGTLELSITDAIGRALQNNLGILTADESIERARGARWLALADMLPNISGRVAETRQKINLEAFGFPLPEGVPSIVGPFNVFDARVFLSQSVLDFHALNNTRAERHNVAAAQYTYKGARDLVVLVAANAYLQALAAGARSSSARAELDTAQALFTQAGDLRQSGLVAGIDVLRAQVQLANAQQRATASANEADKAKLQLAHLIGLPPGQEFSLSDQIPYVPVPDMTFEEALDRAYMSRPDYQAAGERVQAAEAARAAIVGEALPSLRVTADYGDIGLTVGSAHGTFSVVGALNVPIFQGGRTKGRLLQADADLRSRRNELDDLKAQIYYDVRSAFLDLKATSEQLDVATRARDLASQQLTQARDRFAAGVTNNIEVVEAQQAVALADEQYISALYGYNVAKALLARDLGVAEDAIRQFLGGTR
jgi:outer membrane protein TolC